MTADGVTDDLDGDGVIDPIGFYWFEIKPGTYTVYEELESGWDQTFPVAGPGIILAPNGTLGYQITPQSGDQDTGNDFGNEEIGGGLTPGFWKSNAANAARRPEKFAFGGDPNDPLAWHDTGIHPNTPLSDAFGVDCFPAGVTFVQALNMNGGGINALMRHAAAAYLNAAHDEAQVAMGKEPCINYPLSTAEVVDLACDAIADGSAGAINAAKDTLAGFNELGAGLDQFGRCADEAAALLVTKASLLAPPVSFVTSAWTSEAVVDAPETSLEVEATVADAALALAGIDSPVSTVKPSVEARDAVFHAVHGADNLLLLLRSDSDDSDVELFDEQSSTDTDAEDEPFSAIDEMFELLSVA
jgi:hypothetical protein